MTLNLAHELQRLPVRSAGAIQALTVLNDPEADARQIAVALQVDPSLCLRILRLANSAALGMPGTVGDIERAVIALGRDVVQPVVVLAAADVFGTDNVPEGFWQHCAAVAAGAATAAELTNVPVAAAVAAGLLHDVGALLLFRHDPDGWAERVERFGTDHVGLLDEEENAYGANHAELGGCALAEWSLPNSIVEAVANHHATCAQGGLGAVLVVGEALAHAAFDESPFALEPVADLDEALNLLGPREHNGAAMIERTTEKIGAFEVLFAAP